MEKAEIFQESVGKDKKMQKSKSTERVNIANRMWKVRNHSKSRQSEVGSARKYCWFKGNKNRKMESTQKI